MRNGQIYVQLSGHRKPTVIRCNACSEAAGVTVWHRTARGIDPEPCPREALGRPVGRSGVQAKSAAPAFVPREKLGTMPSVRRWHVARLGGTLTE